jgi:hypothetical protein
MDKNIICEQSYKLGLMKGYLEEVIDSREDALPELSAEEVAYRRGFHHGWQCGRSNPEITNQEINAWRFSKKIRGAPGTPLEGKDLS